MKTKTTNNNTSQYNVLIKKNLRNKIKKRRDLQAGENYNGGILKQG